MRKSFIQKLILSSLVLLAACSHNPNKAEKIETKVDSAEQIHHDTVVGVKDGNMVVEKKVMMAEELRKLETDVYTLEDRVYGNRMYGSQGLYGVLKDCRMQLSAPENGGDGKLKWTEPLERVTDKEEEFKIGIDDKNKLIGVTDEFLKDRMDRFRQYKKVLGSREDEFTDKVSMCKLELQKQKETSKAK